MSIAEEEREGQGSNEPTREQCLLDATGCLYKLAAEKACHRWSFMLVDNRTGRSILEFKNYLTLNHGLQKLKNMNQAVYISHNLSNLEFKPFINDAVKG